MKALRITAPICVLVFVVTFAFSAFAQTVSDENVALPKIHRFRPTLPSSPDAAASSGLVDESGLSARAAAQISAMVAEKQSRTPAQAKISSRLLTTSRMLRGLEAVPGIPVLRSGLEVDDQNNLLVDMAARTSEDLRQRLRAAGAKIIQWVPAYNRVQALIPPGQLETIAAFPEVRFISPRRESRRAGAANSVTSRPLFPLIRNSEAKTAMLRQKISSQLAAIQGGISCVGQGSRTSEGYLTHQVDDACTTYGVTGTGVKIGVLSNGVANLAASQALGDLPPTCPAGPPCITVLDNGVAACAANGEPTCDEGTAMLEIIHDLAPNAQLYFATADVSIESFAQNIRALRAAGCDIIVDDVFYFVEQPFQDGQASGVVTQFDGGVVTQAVNDVTANGAMHFSSAGNEGNNDDASFGFTGTYEGDFVDGGSNALLPAGSIHKFGPGANTYNPVNSGGGSFVMLYWADPLGGSTNDYDLYILDAAGANVVDFSTGLQNGNDDPIEGALVFFGERIVVFKENSAANRFFHMIAFNAGVAVTTSGAVIGHPAATGAFAVGAAPANLPLCGLCPAGPWPNPYSVADLVEPFSSDGPRRIFFRANGSAITPGNFSSTGGMVLRKPEFTAADGVSVTGVGGFGSPFFGTSAAAPHAAAIAALIKSVRSTLTKGEIGSLLTNTAVDIMGAGTDNDSGAGIVMAFEAVDAIPNITSISPTFGDVGTPVTISGKSYGGTQGASAVTFNGTVAPVTTWSATSIVVPVPVGATTGSVVVTVNGVTSNGAVFTLIPNITGLSTNTAPAGASITITGTNFGATKGTSTVKFNGVAATVTTWSMTSLVVTVPTNSTGNVVVTVNGVASNGTPFTMEDFGFLAPLADMTLTAGQSQTQTFTITTTAFDAAITFSCTGLPSKSTCTFTPPNITPGANPTTDVAMKVSTTATVPGTASASLGTWLPFGSLGLVLAVGVGSRKRNRKALAGLGLMLAIPVLLTIVSCGGGGSSKIQPVPGTPPGTKTITLRATSGPTSHTATFNLTVQ